MSDRPEKYFTFDSLRNFYAIDGLTLKSEAGKFWWSIANHNGHDWEEIPESLFNELLAFARGKGTLKASSTAQEEAGRWS